MKITLLASVMLAFSVCAHAQLFGGSVSSRRVTNATCTNGQTGTYDASGKFTGCASAGGAANVSATSVSAVTSLAIDISSLSLANLSTLIVQCWSGTAAPFNPVTVTSLNPATTSSITANFTSTANVTCRANSNGGAGATGATGAPGATGAAGTNGTNGTNGTAGTNGAISQLQDEASNLTVRPTINFTGGGVVATDDAGNNRTNVTISGGGGSLPSQTGNSGKFLRTNGTAEAWSFVLTGPTGALDCSTGPCDLVTAVVPLLSTANTYTGANDYSGASSLTTVRGAGDPSTGCSVAGDVGKVYTRSDGAANNNLWVCENNGGTRRWIQPSSAGATFNTTDRGSFLFGIPSTPNITVLTQFQPRYIGKQFESTQTIRQMTMYTGGTGNLRVGLYESTSGNLLGQSATVANSGAIVATFSPAITLTPGYYYVAIISDHATGGQVRAATASNLDGVLMNTGATEPQLFTGATLGSIALPATIGTRTALSGFDWYTPAIYARP